MKTEPNESATGYGFTTANGESHVNENSLTKREHFASLAMQGYISADFTANSGTPHEDLAKWAVGMADALIEALNKGE